MGSSILSMSMLPPDPTSNVVPFPPGGQSADPGAILASLPPPAPNISPMQRRGELTKKRESYARSHVYTAPAPDDPELANTVRELFFQARAAKRPMLGRWNQNYLYLRNRPNQLPTGTRSQPLVPEIFPIIASKVGWKMDRRIRNSVSSSAVPFSEWWIETGDLAEDLGTVLDATWHVNQEEAEVSKMLWDAEIYGTGILKTSWLPELAGGLGDATYRRVDPFTFYPDPDARGMDDALYFIETRTMSLQEIDKRWPGSAKRIREGAWMEQADEAPTQLENYSRVPRANPGAISPATVPRYGMVGGGFLSATDEPGVTVIEAWLRCHDSVEDDTAPYGYRTEEYWRVVVIAGNHILMDEQASDLWTHGGHPYSRHVPQDIGEFWGFSTVELLIPTQRSINRLLSALQSNIELTGNPVMVDEYRAGISRTQATNRPGQRFTVGNGSKVDWLKPPPINQMMPELIRYMLQRMEAVSGLAAVTRGGTTPGRNAQGVMDAMQEAAFVRIRMELKQLEFTLTDAGTKKASLIVENYTEPRMLSIVGADGAKQMLSLQERHFLLPTAEGEAPLNYTLLVDAGSNEHTSRKVREDTAMSLANMGILDQAATLEALDFPGRSEIIKRMTPIWQAQAQAAAAKGA